MLKFLSKVKFLFIIGAIFLFATSCTEDGEEVTTAKLVGTWTITNVTLGDVGGMSMTGFISEMMGLSEVQAAILAPILETTMLSQYTGNIEFKDDMTYLMQIAGEDDDGTWSLNSAGDKIILDAGTQDEQIIEIVSLNNNTLVLALSVTELTDMDDDPETADIPLDLSLEMTLAK
jgi:hypothetical protein